MFFSARKGRPDESQGAMRLSSLTTADGRDRPSIVPDKPRMAADSDDIVYPTGIRLALVMTSIFVGMFLVTLDRLIVSTAVPKITNEFDAAGDTGWIGTAYLLSNCAFQLLFGKLYTLFSIKATFIVSIVLFEIGSALCGAAPNMIAFLFGRAIAGLGGGGVLSGVLAILVHILPLQKRPKYQGFFGAMFAVASIMGPLVGGAFTTDVTWRWCFYLNLPIGGAVLVFVSFFLHVHGQPSSRPAVAGRSFTARLRRLDGPGMLALVAGVVCLCLALQWGGTPYSWRSARIIALLVAAVALLLAFVAIQLLLPSQATLPPRILLQRSIASALLSSCCTGAHMSLFSYYLPIWFQAIQGVSAITSGIRTLPMMIPVVVASIVTGVLVSRLGYYTPFLILGACLSAIATGLLTTLTVDAHEGHWVGFQLLYGFGLGFSSQAPNMAAQTVLPRADVALGASFMFFGQQLFGAIFTSVGENVLGNQLARRLDRIPGLDITPQQIQDSGVTDLLGLVPAAALPAALTAYNNALRACFRVGLIMACVGVPAALCMEWRSVQAKDKKETKGSERPSTAPPPQGGHGKTEKPEDAESH